MKNFTTKKEGITILSEMTRKDLERNLRIKDIDNVNAVYTPRHGWHFRLKKDLNPSSKIWQDDYK